MQTLTAKQIENIEQFLNKLASSEQFDFGKTILPIVGAKTFIKVIIAFHKDFIGCQSISSDGMSQHTKKAFCHKLKSAAANIGAIRLSQYCIACEQDLEHIDADISNVTIELHDIFTQVENGLVELDFLE